MQDPSGASPLRSLAASCSRLLGDRRLRPHLNQAVKCPRCDSVNTKFCYYNNYNLSQPRHFCKGCRRYWTKGGVLRNVPEGGGCRKAKRSKQKSSVEGKTKKESTSTGKTSSHSSSESSSLTATEASSTSNSVTENPVQPPALTPQPVPMFDPILTFPETRMFASPNAASTSLLDSVGMINFSTDSLNSGSIFAETTSFTSLMTGNSIPTISSGMGTSGSLAFNFSDIPLKFPSSSRMVDHLRSSGVPSSMTEIVSSINDLPSPLQQQSNMSNGEITTPLEWESSVDRHNVFDLPPTVDPSYWMQNQWTTDEDHPPLYLP